MLKDDHSGLVWLKPTEKTDAYTAAHYRIEWFSLFGFVTQWVSDRGTHFRNELVSLLPDIYKVNHYYTLAYSPWSNGTVEVVNKELFRATRALLSEFQLSQLYWPSALHIVHSDLNNSKLQRLGNRCPLTIFTQLPADSPLTSIMSYCRGIPSVHSINEVRVLQKVSADLFHVSMDDMHKDVA